MSDLLLVPDISPPATLPVGVIFGHQTFSFQGSYRVMSRLAEVPEHAAPVMKAKWKANRVEFLKRGFSIWFRPNNKVELRQYLAQRKGGYSLTPKGQEKYDSVVNPLPAELPIPEEEVTPLDLVSLPAALEAKLYDYQVEPARQIYRALTHGKSEWGYAGAWDASELGTGKTYMSLAAALATGLEVGVVCPIGVKPSWRDAFAHFGHVPLFITNYEKLRTGRREHVKTEKYYRPNGTVGTRYAWTHDPQHTILLFDEAHRAKTAGSLTQGLLIAACRQEFPHIDISGTIATDPTHMRATGRAVGLHKGGDDFKRFLRDYGCTQPSPKSENWKFCGGRRGHQILANLHHRIFPKRGARVRIEELGDKFPETQIIVEAYDTGKTKEIEAEFEKAKLAIEKLRDEHRLAPEKLEFLSLAAFMNAWHGSERLKVDAIVSLAKEEMENGRSVAIFVNFSDVRESVMEKLKTTCGIFGGQHEQARERAIATFQSDESRVIVCNMEAGGVGVSLHDKHGNHPRTAIILPNCKVVSIMQALGRVHRAGGKSKSRQIILYADAEPELSICANVRRKMQNITALNEGDMNPQAKF